MTTKTYTLLVTITNDRAIEAEDLAEHVAAVLEVGCEGWSGVSSATVDAVAGDQLFGGAEFGAHIKALHAELRA